MPAEHAARAEAAEKAAAQLGGKMSLYERRVAEAQKQARAAEAGVKTGASREAARTALLEARVREAESGAAAAAAALAALQASQAKQASASQQQGQGAGPAGAAGGGGAAGEGGVGPDGEVLEAGALSLSPDEALAREAFDARALAATLQAENARLQKATAYSRRQEQEAYDAVARAVKKTSAAEEELKRYMAAHGIAEVGAEGDGDGAGGVGGAGGADVVVDCMTGYASGDCVERDD
jgi:hypothetical protein